MLVQSNFAVRKGNTLVLSAKENKQDLIKKKWLYYWMKSVKYRDVKEIFND